MFSCFSFFCNVAPLPVPSLFLSLLEHTTAIFKVAVTSASASWASSNSIPNRSASNSSLYEVTLLSPANVSFPRSIVSKQCGWKYPQNQLFRQILWRTLLTSHHTPSIAAKTFIKINVLTY